MKANTEKACVLVVDDTRVNRLVLEGWLAKDGYKVICASGGTEALQILGLDQESGSPPDRFDAVVLDIMMPEVDGFEVLQRLRKVKSAIELPVIMATTRDRSEDIVHALEQGSNDYVTKPIDSKVLLARLQTQVTLRRTHLALKKAQQSLVNAARMESVGYLAAGVAHEVRNPLAQIQMGVDAIRGSSAVEADPHLEMVLPIITEAVARADAIINDLMRVSTTGEFELNPGSINTPLEEGLDEIKAQAKDLGVEMEIELAEDLPAVPMAAAELRQAFAHVLTNSLDAMPDGGRLIARTSLTKAPEIPPDEGSRSAKRLRSGDTAILVEILDTGTGIPKDVLPSIFEPFFTTKPTGQATGMGLSLVRKVIHLHNGLVTVENRGDASGVRFAGLFPIEPTLMAS